MEKIKRKCKKCNKEFLLRYRNSDKIFCSKSCATSFRKTGKKTGFVPSTAFRKGQRSWNYIDGRSMNKGPDRYGDDWDNIRITVYKRDKYTCQECFQTMSEQKRAFHIHHKVPFLISFDNSLNNLITLCPSCHRKIEVKIMKENRVVIR